MKIYGSYARLLQLAFKIVHPRWRVEDRSKLEGSAVYLVHHQNMFGPLHALCLVPKEMRMWSLHCFCDKESCFKQYYHYTFQKRYGWSERRSYYTAKFLSCVVPPVLHSFKVIPVYHNTANVVTMRKSLKAFEAGEPLILCPDIDYASKSPEIGELYTGFLVLDALYMRKSEEHLPFVPLFCSKKQKKIVIGEPITFETKGAYREESPLIAEKIRRAMNDLGRECGDIPVA